MEAIKKRILQFAGTIETELHFFTVRIFGSEEFFAIEDKLTIAQLVDLADMYPELNMNWVLTGKGGMLYNSTDTLVDVLEEGLQEKQREIEELKARLQSVQIAV